MSEEDRVESLCRNCGHSIVLHHPACYFKNDEFEDEACNCSKPEYYNTIPSNKHMGWIEIHCNSCGILIGLINSAMENLYDFITLCPRCIERA